MLMTVVGGLKDALQKRAAKAIGVVAGAVVPGVLAQAQDAKDEREGRSAFRQALYQAASARAASDTALIDRMLDRLVDEEFGKQDRRDSVAILAIEHLKEDQPEQPAGAEEIISDDWLNIFTGYAEKASSEQLQDMWSRVLAGEIRKPNSVSLKTLQFVSVLDKETAEATVTALPWLIGGAGLWEDAQENLPLKTRRLLKDSGLLGNSEYDTQTNVDDRFPGVWFCRFRKMAVVIDRKEGCTFSYKLISVSKIATELSKIIPYEDDTSIIMKFAEHCKTQTSVSRVRVGPYNLIDGNFILPGSSLIHDWTRTSEAQA